MIKISFILPMYKSEKYLKRVVESLKNQTMGDFEAIFVDDGSPDKSGELCEKLFSGDSRFKLIRKENGGVSSARNAGLNIALGKYIFFVDPDDCIENESCEILWNTAEKENADIVFFGRSNDYYKNDVLLKSEKAFLDIEGTYNDKPCQTHFDKIATSYFVTDKLFKREIIEENNLRFRNMNIGEDGVFVFEYLACDPKCAVFLKKAFYHYTIDESETLSSSYHKERDVNNFILSNTVRKAVVSWGLSESKVHIDIVKYCTVRDLQLGIKNINLSEKSFNEKYLWLKKIMKDKWVRNSVQSTPVSMSKSRNDKIKLVLLKLHLYCTVTYISGLNQKRGRKK